MRATALWRGVQWMQWVDIFYNIKCGRMFLKASLASRFYSLKMFQPRLFNESTLSSLERSHNCGIPYHSDRWHRPPKVHCFHRFAAIYLVCLIVDDNA